MRSSKAIPYQLRTIYFSPIKPYSALSNKLKTTLTAIHVKLKDNPTQAPFTLAITQDDFVTSRAEITNANLPSSISYTQTATIAISSNTTKKVIISKSFSASVSVILNVNQLYMPSSDYEIKNTLNQAVVTQIYYWITTDNLKMLLKNATHA